MTSNIRYQITVIGLWHWKRGALLWRWRIPNLRLKPMTLKIGCVVRTCELLEFLKKWKEPTRCNLCLSFLWKCLEKTFFPSRHSLTVHTGLGYHKHRKMGERDLLSCFSITSVTRKREQLLYQGNKISGTDSFLWISYGCASFLRPALGGLSTLEDLLSRAKWAGHTWPQNTTNICHLDSNALSPINGWTIQETLLCLTWLVITQLNAAVLPSGKLRIVTKLHSKGKCKW